MVHWWQWQNAGFGLQFVADVLAALALIGAILIPLVIWRLGRRANEQIAGSISRIEGLQSRARRDQLLGILPVTKDHVILRALSSEVFEFPGADGRLLRRVLRSNPDLPLPGADETWLEDGQRLDAEAIAAYVGSLEDRYRTKVSLQPYGGLLDFLEHALENDPAETRRQESAIVRLVTGECAAIQRPGHQFFRSLVTLLPDTAVMLLHQIERIDQISGGGLRLNILTGVLLALNPAAADGQVSSPDLREGVLEGLAHLLHRDVLRSLDRWSLDGSTEPVSATVAWLIRAVGELSDLDSWLAMRAIENLSRTIRSIPEQDRGWGIDGRDVRAGFAAMRTKAPVLWAEHRRDLEAAADEIGDWRTEIL